MQDLDWLTLVGISVGLAMDALAVSIAAGLVIGHVTPRHVFRIAFHFGLFQFLMPVVGWLCGSALPGGVLALGRWLAFVLLSLVGGRMLWHARRADGSSSLCGDPSRGWLLVCLSTAVSIDALAAGLSMAFVRVSVWFPSLVIGLVASGFSLLGIVLAGRLLRRCDRVANIVGGVVLLLIGFRIVLLAS